MSNITVCKDCTDRELGCHDRCEKYLNEKRANSLLKAKIKIEKEPVRFQIGQIVKYNDKKVKKRRHL